MPNLLARLLQPLRIVAVSLHVVTQFICWLAALLFCAAANSHCLNGPACSQLRRTMCYF